MASRLRPLNARTRALYASTAPNFSFFPGDIGAQPGAALHVAAHGPHAGTPNAWEPRAQDGGLQRDVELRTAELPERSRFTEAQILEGPRNPRAQKSIQPPTEADPQSLRATAALALTAVLTSGGLTG